VADRVDAAVKHMQAAALDAVVDGVERQAERGELAAGHHAVLAGRERREASVGWTRATLTVYFRHNVARVSHRAIVPGWVCRYITRSHQLCARTAQRWTAHGGGRTARSPSERSP
jgi:hypothetical protein